MTPNTTAQNRREEIIEKIPTFPSIPTAAIRVRRLLAKPEVDFDELADLIRYDQALTANLLRIANTIAFGGRQKVTTVEQTLVRLGTRHVSQMVTGIAAAPLLKKEVQGYDLAPEQLWKHAMAVGIGAEELARHQDTRVPELAFTAGLLHDIGKVALGTFLDADVDEIKSAAFDHGLAFQAAERRVLGIDHAELGARLLRHWGLPDELVLAARWHHEPDEHPGDYRVVDLVHVADGLSLQAGIGAGTDGLQYNHCSDTLDRLNVTRHLIEKVLLEVESELEELRDLFGEPPKGGQ